MQEKKQRWEVLSVLYAANALFMPLAIFFILLLLDRLGLWGSKGPVWLILIMVLTAIGVFVHSVMKTMGAGNGVWHVYIAVQVVSFLVFLCWLSITLVEESWGITMFLFPVTAFFCLICLIQAFRFGFRAMRSGTGSKAMAYLGISSLPVLVVAIFIVWVYI